MAFDYNGTINKANAINEYADLIKSYKNEIISLKSSLNDCWKNAMVPQVPELFHDADVNLDNVYWELKLLYEDIISAADYVREQERIQQLEAQRIAEENKRKEEEAAAALRAEEEAKENAKKTTVSTTKTKTTSKSKKKK